jgi:sterol 3beta-glucosyltransferase
LFSVLRDQKVPVFFALSPTVIRRPADWPEHVHMNGYWFLDSSPGWEPAPGLVDFIQAGPPPVYIGFGSMANQEPKQMAQLVIEALQRCGQRGLLASGWGGLKSGELPGSIFTIDQAPHAWLFPQMAAVVHHGGAGTTAAGLRAGVPGIVIPHMQDQPYWGRRVHDLGVGPAPIPRRKLTAGKLTNAITQAVGDQDIREKARLVGEKIRAEDGLGRTVKLIEAYLSQ